MINTPYPELYTDTTATRAAFAEWNAGIQRARQEYRLNPTAACGVSDCDRLRAHGRMCRIHAGPNYRSKQ